MCSCDYDDERPDVWNATHQKARKEYECDECCRRAIKPGDRYKKIVALWYGSWEAWRICSKCERIRKAHNKADPDCNPAIEELRECVREAIQEQGKVYIDAFREAWKEQLAS